MSVESRTCFENGSFIFVDAKELNYFIGYTMLIKTQAEHGPVLETHPMNSLVLKKDNIPIQEKHIRTKLLRQTKTKYDVEKIDLP